MPVAAQGASQIINRDEENIQLARLFCIGQDGGRKTTQANNPQQT